MFLYIANQNFYLKKNLLHTRGIANTLPSNIKIEPVQTLVFANGLTNPTEIELKFQGKNPLGFKPQAALAVFRSFTG